ncbi:hypothetical protein [Bradyrhizobium sp. URHC0002]
MRAVSQKRTLAAKLGNFVETKAATLEAGAKVNHLPYVGDIHVGANAHLGAGTIWEWRVRALRTAKSCGSGIRC